MFPIPWYAVLLISVPQTYLIIKVGSNLFNLDVRYKKCLVISLIVGVITYFVRRVLIMNGVHTIILALSIIILLNIVAKIELGHSFVLVLLGLIIMGILESTCLPVFFKLTSNNITSLTTNPRLNILANLPELILALIIYCIVKKYHFILFDLKSKGEQVNAERS